MAREDKDGSLREMELITKTSPVGIGGCFRRNERL
jgi:hypothetical protein